MRSKSKADGSPDPAADPVDPVPGPALRLRASAAAMARKGRLWFYADDLVDGALPERALVRLVDERDRDLGLAFASSKSRLALRACGPWPEAGVPDRESFFQRRLDAAIERRAGRLGREDGVRIVHGESDGVPGLVVDRYGPVTVLQSTSAVVEHALDAIVPHLVRRLSAEAVVGRNDTSTRRHEGLPREVRLLHGRRIEEVSIVEHGVRHQVQPFTGHKTGFYLDQRPARARVRELAKGRRVLDLFSYQGAFSLCALAGGASSVLAVDQSAAALERARVAADSNGLGGLEVAQANAFDLARELRKEERLFDLIVLDPPAFAKSRRELAGGLRGYRDLNRQAMRLLAPHGLLVTCSCSFHVSLPRFEEVLRQAAAGLPFACALTERLGAGSDHPAILSLPESEYLKVVVLQRLD
ncbi:MAG: class I SAM-dependent rRNA methyltransferase [Planctomycetota bacterium]|nr:class I SAM-dependent rRNA methyltransferase [Planctomycetota bacterium]